MLRCRTVLKRDSNSTNLTSDHPYRAPAVTCELLHLGGWVGLASLMIWVLGPPPCEAGRAGTHPFCSCTLATFECFQINFNFGGADARRLTGGGPAPQTTAAVECPTLWSTHLNRFEPPRSYCASVRCPTSQFQISLNIKTSEMLLQTIPNTGVTASKQSSSSLLRAQRDLGRHFRKRGDALLVKDG